MSAGPRVRRVRRSGGRGERQRQGLDLEEPVVDRRRDAARHASRAAVRRGASRRRAARALPGLQHCLGRRVHLLAGSEAVVRLQAQAKGQWRTMTGRAAKGSRQCQTCGVAEDKRYTR